MHQQEKGKQMSDTKTKLKHYAARIEWHDTRWVDVAVSAPTLEEACKLAYQEANYDAQDTYDDSGDSYISKIAAFPTRAKADDCEQRGNLWDVTGLPVPIMEQGREDRYFAAARAMLAALRDLMNSADNVVSCWETGDLAGAVNMLDADRDTARKIIAQAEAAGITAGKE